MPDITVVCRTTNNIWRRMKQKLIARMKWAKARNKAMDRILARIPKEEQPTEDTNV